MGRYSKRLEFVLETLIKVGHILLVYFESESFEEVPAFLTQQ